MADLTSEAPSTPVPAANPSIDGLPISRREAEVLDALAQRLTNAEIAARLFISVRTVESHVSALLRKLGASDRHALAEVAAARAAAAVVAPAPPLPSLPEPVTSFVGRGDELASVDTILR